MNANKTNVTINRGESDTVIVKTYISEDVTQYYPNTLELINAPSWVTMEDEDSFYTGNDSKQYIQRVINIAVPSDEQAGDVSFTVKNTLTWKEFDDNGDVCTQSDSGSVQITISIRIPAVGPLPGGAD